MLSDNALIIILTLSGVWLVVLTVVVFWVLKYFRKLSKNTKQGNLIKVLDKVLSKQSKNKASINKVEKELAKLEEDTAEHVQKIGLVRFNPFNEIGGDHSFSLALLDGKGTGIVFTSLHTRERTRIYLKPITKGKSELDLSKEENNALSRALKTR